MYVTCNYMSKVRPLQLFATRSMNFGAVCISRGCVTTCWVNSVKGVAEREKPTSTHLFFFTTSVDPLPLPAIYGNFPSRVIFFPTKFSTKSFATALPTVLAVVNVILDSSIRRESVPRHA